MKIMVKIKHSTKNKQNKIDNNQSNNKKICTKKLTKKTKNHNTIMQQAQAFI
jgi:hypothetical protein